MKRGLSVVEKAIKGIQEYFKREFNIKLERNDVLRFAVRDRPLYVAFNDAQSLGLLSTDGYVKNLGFLVPYDVKKKIRDEMAKIPELTLYHAEFILAYALVVSYLELPPTRKPKEFKIVFGGGKGKVAEKASARANAKARALLSEETKQDN